MRGGSSSRDTYTRTGADAHTYKGRRRDALVVIPARRHRSRGSRCRTSSSSSSSSLLSLSSSVTVTRSVTHSHCENRNRSRFARTKDFHTPREGRGSGGEFSFIFRGSPRRRRISSLHLRNRAGSFSATDTATGVMKPRTSPSITRIIVICLLSTVGESIAAMEETSSSSLHIPRLNLSLNTLGYEKPSEKKAYVYVSEYKRLPLYNFGIGKRWVEDNNEDKRTRQFSFGIGKRVRDYKFGLGKRNNAYHPPSLDYFSVDNLRDYHSGEDNFMMDTKRGSQSFDFGIGKRAWKLATRESFSERRPNDVVDLKYLFGPNNGMVEDEELAR